MYNPQREINHVGSSLAKLLEQFKNKPGITGFHVAFINRVQELEDAAWEVILKRNIDTGEGVQLDTIGRIVLRGRNGLSDFDYRVALRAQIRINRSNGTPEDILDVSRLSLAGIPFEYSEQYPAQITVYITDPVPFDINVLFANLKTTKASGVRLLLEFSPADADDRFAFAPSGTSVPSITQGFSDASNPGTGGELGDVLVE